MNYPKIPLAQTLIEICRLKGLEHIVISPGSRNAPLTIGFASHPDFKCYSIADERCAGFFAMGMAQQLQKPVAVVCTSGSALLNYYPAVAEAFYNQIPLVLISADRPHDKIDIGDGQTIRQENVYANHILYNANLTEEVSETNDFKIQEALHLAKTQFGPVHINIPFEEPLYETVTELSVTPKLFEFEPVKDTKIIAEDFIETWKTAKKKLVLIGGNYPNAIEQYFLDSLASNTSVVVMTEVTSNVHHSNFISNIDTVITPFRQEDFIAFQPDVLLTMGGMIVSKRIKAFLRNYQPKQHWHVDTLRAYDTYGCLSHHFKMAPNAFFRAVLNQEQYADSNYQSDFLKIRNERALAHQAYLETTAFSDLKVFETIFKLLPKNIQLQISNSSPIRYAQLFPVDSSIDVFCNRGTSGIDGSTTTAIGSAVIHEKPTIFITGDISFFYDSNALWNNYIPKNFKIILINNSGGGIFRILPGHQENETFNTFFETSHQLTAEHLAKMYQLEYLQADDLKSVESNWNLFLNAEKPVIFEIFTPEKLNNGVLLNYFKNLK